MAETWYARTGTGAACGPGTRRPLSQTPGTTPATQDITSEHTWNRVESARAIQAGNWSVVADVTTGSGGGAPNRVTCVVERRNSSCVVQQTILNVQSGNLTAGATQEITFGPVDPGEVTFNDGDILTVRFVRSNGNRSQTLRFDDDPGTDADTRLIHPDETGAVTPIAASDSVNTAAQEGSPGVLAGLTAADTPGVTAQESIPVLLALLVRADAVDTVALESIPAILAFLTRNDTVELATPEGVPVILANLVRLDTSNIAVTDLASLIAQLGAADSALLSIGEGPPTLSVVLSASDALGIAGNEGTPAILVLLDRADSLDTEALAIAPLILSELLRIDSLDAGVAEGVTALLASLLRVDASDISVQEGTPSVSVVLASADTLAAAIQEGSPALLAALNRADALDLSLAEAASLIASLARNDELSATVSESTAIAVTLSRSEGLGITAEEGAAGITVVVGASDVANLSASEIESLFIALLRADVLAAVFSETSRIDQSSQQHILAPVVRRMIVVPDRMLKVSKEYRAWVVPPEERSVKA